MSVKYFDKEKGEWKIFPGVNGMSAYDAAKLGGFSGSEDEFNSSLSSIKDLPNKYQDKLDNSDKLFTLNGVDIYYNSEIEIESINGKDGKDGADGKDGVDGKDGINGVDGKDGQDGKDGINGESYIMYYASPSCNSEKGIPSYPANTSSLSSLEEAGWYPDFNKALKIWNDSDCKNLYNFIWAYQIVVKYNQDGSIKHFLMSDLELAPESELDKYKVIPTLGIDGQNGKAIYPAGIYNAESDYVATRTSAPYVYNKATNKYYIYNWETSWHDILNEDPMFENAKPEDLTFPQYSSEYWIEMDNFNAIYAEIGIIENGTIGDAVFNQGKMFSQDGAYYDDNKKEFVDTSEGDGKYALFGSYIDDNLNRDYYSDNHKFHPNTMINFDTGKAVFGRGTVQLAESSKDTSIFDSKVEINNGFSVENRNEQSDDVYHCSNINVDSNASNISSTIMDQSLSVAMIEARNNGSGIAPQIYIQAPDPRRGIEGVEGINDYSRITLQEYINRCIYSYLHGNVSSETEILGINSHKISSSIFGGDVTTNEVSLRLSSHTFMQAYSYEWDIADISASVKYNIQECTGVPGAIVSWNCTQTISTDINANISISDSKLLYNDMQVSTGVVSISGVGSGKKLCLNTMNSVSGVEYQWTSATAVITLSPIDSSFTVKIKLTIDANE